MQEVFQIFDKDGNKTIDRTEAQKHWAQVRFGKVSANEFFNTVDFNGDGQIQFDEFVEFWEIVKGAGHTEDEIKEEVSVRGARKVTLFKALGGHPLPQKAL